VRYIRGSSLESTSEIEYSERRRLSRHGQEGSRVSAWAGKKKKSILKKGLRKKNEDNEGGKLKKQELIGFIYYSNITFIREEANHREENERACGTFGDKFHLLLINNEPGERPGRGREN